MSSAPTQLAVAPSASTLVTTTTQIKKEFLEESSYCQNSLPPRSRGGLKGKPLTRSHAMRESASPPRTPTPRSSADGLDSSPTSFSGSVSAATHSHSSSSETINDYKLQVQSLSPSPLLTSSSIPGTPTAQTQESITPLSLGPANNQQHISTTTAAMYSSTESNGVLCSQSQLDVDFPKLTPPKSKGHRNHNNNVNRDSSEKQLNVSSDSSASSASSKLQQQSGNFGSGPMISNSDAKAQNKNTENDIMKMNHHNNNNNKNNRGNLQTNGQSPPMQKQSQSQRRNQSSHSIQQLHESHQTQQQHNHQIQTDSNLVNNFNNLQISSPPPQTHQMCLDKETTNNNRYMRANDENCSTPIGGNHNQINCMNSSCNSAYGHDENRNNVLSESPTDNTNNMSMANAKCDRQMSKKHRNSANAKGSKARLKNMGSSSSVEGGNSTSGFISRDSSTEQFTDASGIDLKEFFRETLSKNPIDRCTLLDIEKDLTELVHDKTRNDIQYPAMSSYNRMLIHRVAAFFGMEHNVDSTTPQCVIVSKTKQSRIPSIKFKSLYRANDTAPRKSILKRDAYSFDEPPRRNLLNCPDRGMLDRKAKSYEQREEEYEQVRKRIFRAPDGSGEMNEWQSSQWCGNESPEHSNRLRHNKLLKVQSMSSESRQDGRPSVSKSHSFGGYGGPPPSGGPLTRGDSINSTRSAGARLFPKQDSINSTNTPWRLSPSSSGSIYHFDPSNLPPSQAVPPGTYSNNKTSSGVTSGHRKIVVDKPKVIRSDSHNGSINSTTNNNTQELSGANNIGSGGSGQPPPTINETSSVENSSESSAQSVLIVETNSAGHDGEHEANVTKDSHPHREMSDIQEESIESFAESGSQSNEDKPAVTMDSLTDTQDKPKLINQATSPNIPSPEPEQPALPNEKLNVSAVETNPSQSSINTTSASTPSSTTIVQQTSYKKDDTSSKPSSATPNIPLMSFAPTGYQAIDGSTVFASPTNGPFPTAAAYQTGPDGSVYAVPQPMVYAYPPPMEGDFPGYFMPVYDQSQRDPNGLVAAAPAQAIYQPAGGPTTTVVAYPTAAPYGGAPLYQGQVVYSPADQFTTAASGGQLQQYPVPTYPVSYTYPYNGYWGQTAMTYYVPQPAPPPIASSIIPQPLTGTVGGVTSLGSSTGHSSNGNSSNGTKRSTPPQNNLSSGHNSQSATPAAASTYQFATTAPPGLPLTALAATAGDPNGPPGTTMYAIPQAATVFPSVLPYAPPPGTPSGVLSHHLPAPGSHHPQPNAVINPLISTQTASGLGVAPQIPIDATVAPNGNVIGGVGYTLNTAIADRNGSHGGHNNSGTPHSAPSTPLSNSVSLPHQHRNPPPLFATPPILPSNYNNPMQSHYSQFTDVQNGICNSYSSTSNYERRNSSKRNNGGYAQNSRQNSYTSNQNTRKTNINDITNNTSSPSMNQNGNRSSLHMQQKRINNSDKTQSSMNSSNANNAQNNGSNHNLVDKSRNSSITNNGGGATNNGNNTSGIRTKPSNLDFRRSVSQRNSPSTNSMESNNNSPNSIASMNHMSAVATHSSSLEHPPPMYITRGTHIPPMHPPTAAAVVAAAAAAAAVANDACHPQLIGAAYNHPAAAAPTGMYIKYGQPYFAHPSMALPNNRRSPPNDLRPQLAPIAGVYSTVNMMLPAPRTMPPRQPNPNYKGNKPSR